MHYGCQSELRVECSETANQHFLHTQVIGVRFKTESCTALCWNFLSAGASQTTTVSPLINYFSNTNSSTYSTFWTALQAANLDSKSAWTLKSIDWKYATRRVDLAPVISTCFFFWFCPWPLFLHLPLTMANKACPFIKGKKLHLHTLIR